MVSEGDEIAALESALEAKRAIRGLRQMVADAKDAFSGDRSDENLAAYHSAAEALTDARAAIRVIPPPPAQPGSVVVNLNGGEG